MPLHPASVCMLGIWTQVLSLKGKQSTNQDVFLASDFRLLISCLSLLSKVDRISGLQHQVPLEQGLLYPPSQSPLTQSSSWLSYSCITFPNALSNYLRLSGLRLWIKEGMKSLRVFVAIDLCVPLCLAFNKAFFLFYPNSTMAWRRWITTRSCSECRGHWVCWPSSSGAEP